MYQQRYQNIIQGETSEQDEQTIKIPQFILYRMETFHNELDPSNGYQKLKTHLDFSQIKARYDFIHEISGTLTSVVIKCRRKIALDLQQFGDRANIVAVKICYNAQQQAAILYKLSHIQNCHSFVRMFQFYKNSIVLQLFDGNLKDVILWKIQLKNTFIIKIMRQCLEGLAILQKQRLVHGDIKPDNILYFSEGQRIKYYVLSDFSSSFYIQQNKRPICKQTWSYKAPQWLKQNTSIDNRIDIWGLGCVLFECMTGQNLLPLQIQDDKSYQKNLRIFASKQSIKNRLQRFSFGSQRQKFQDIMFSMLQIDPRKRPSIAQLIQTFQKLQLE